MKKFIKLTGTDEGLLAENLVNIGDAVAIQFTGIQACRVYFGLCDVACALKELSTVCFCATFAIQ